MGDPSTRGGLAQVESIGPSSTAADLRCGRGSVAERSLVVYTVALGALPPSTPRSTEGVRFVCISDRQTGRSDWEFFGVDALPADLRGSPERSVKISPHRGLARICPGLTQSLYVDPGLVLVGNLDSLIRGLAGVSFAAGVLPSRSCRDVAEQALVPGANHLPALTRTAAHLEALGAIDLPCPDTRLVWRSHVDVAVAQLCDRWLESSAASSSPSVAAAMDDITLAALVADEQGSFARHPVRPEATRVDELCIRNPNVPIRRSNSLVGSGAVPITFLRHPRAAGAITTVLRGEQMSAIIRDRFPERFDVTYNDDLNLRDQVVIVTNEAIARLSPEEIAAMAQRNRAVVLAWDDRLPDRRRLAAADAHMFFSYRQIHELADVCPERPKFYVTQHVNVDLPRGRAPHDSLEVAYFGDLRNTEIPASLIPHVKVVDTLSTPGQYAGQQAWMQHLLTANCHWAVRRRHRWDGGKPFMKGFVAARFGATIITPRDEDDAEFYLGPDYPYFLEPDRSPLETYEFVRETFGGSEWQLAREIMREVEHQSSIEQMCREFDVMVRFITEG